MEVNLTMAKFDQDAMDDEEYLDPFVRFIHQNKVNKIDLKDLLDKDREPLIFRKIKHDVKKKDSLVFEFHD